MPEPASTPPPGDNPPAPPTSPAGGEGATPPAGGTPPDPIALAKRVGELEGVKTEYESYRQKADPVLETLWSDQELLKTVTAAHNKRLGINTPAPDKPDNPSLPAPSQGNSDERLSQINMLQQGFETKAGIDKMTPEQQKDVRGKVGVMLKEMLDPKGNKTIPQVFEEVSLVKLPWYLDQAWKLINRDNEIAAAREAGKTEKQAEYEGQTGMIGSMPAGTIPIDQVQLSQVEKNAASRMGISEEDYLKYKKKKIEENA
jgi:hypothetical protein